MIGKLTGIPESINPTTIILDVHGVGYEVSVPPNILRSIKPVAETVLYIHTHVRDDALELYGFTLKRDLDLFNLLLTVSGVGPKTALLVIDRGYHSVEKAIISSDVDFFTTIPRLGKKNAQKIIIELKSKIGSTKELDLREEGDSETKAILDALIGMGFGKSEAVYAIRKIQKTEATLENKIREALKYIGKHT